MKLIIQIPCFNEAETLPATIADLPKSIPGVDSIELLVIDDGSRDGTAGIARQLGVHHVLVNRENIGLARSFARGIDHAITLGADVIVNTDGDNQYYGADIAKLVAPIISGDADVVIGDRQTNSIAHFSRGKRMLQKVGSFIVRSFSGVNVPDAVSGFRAMSRAAALQINIVSTFSYTIEMLIQVGKKGMLCTSVPIRTNSQTRESRLFKSIFQFVERSGTTALRMYAMYQPLRTFLVIGIVIALVGMIPFARFLYFFLFISGEGKIQSLVIGSALLIAGLMTFVMGIMADLLGRNRQLLEMTLIRVRNIELQLSDRAGEHKAVSEKLYQRGNSQNEKQSHAVAQASAVDQHGEGDVFTEPKAAVGPSVGNQVMAPQPRSAPGKDERS